MRIALKPLIAYSLPLTVFATEALAASSAHSDDAHAAAEHSTGGLPQIDPQWFASQIFWLAVTFTVLYVIFGKKVLPELSAILDQRREHISENLETAKSLKAEAETVQASYEEALVDARNKSSALFVTTQEKSKAKAQKKQDSMQEKAMRIIRETEDEIAQATNVAMAEMTDVAAEVASEAAKKIIGVSTDKKAAKSVVENINKKAA